MHSNYPFQRQEKTRAVWSYCEQSTLSCSRAPALKGERRSCTEKGKWLWHPPPSSEMPSQLSAATDRTKAAVCLMNRHRHFSRADAPEGVSRARSRTLPSPMPGLREHKHMPRIRGTVSAVSIISASENGDKSSLFRNENTMMGFLCRSGPCKFCFRSFRVQEQCMLDACNKYTLQNRDFCNFTQHRNKQTCNNCRQSSEALAWESRHLLVVVRPWAPGYRYASGLQVYFSIKGVELDAMLPHALADSFFPVRSERANKVLSAAHTWKRTLGTANKTRLGLKK